MSNQSPECAGCGTTDIGDRFWVPHSFPGVALCEACQFQQQRQQLSHQHQHYEQSRLENTPQSTQWCEHNFSTGDESPGMFIRARRLLQTWIFGSLI